MESTSRTPVLIVGAGPAGLALAIELGSRSIPCIVVERNDRVGYAPRAKTTHSRTREHLRRWGIAGALAEASPFGIDYPSDVIFATRLGGHPLTTIRNAFNCDPAPDPLYSEHAQWIPQYLLEEVLRRHAETLPAVEIRFNAEFEGFEQDGETVRSRVRDRERGVSFIVESDYLVGADGARSTVREQIGARMEGRYGLSRNYNIVFRAPGLADAHRLDRGIMYWQVNADVPSLIGPMDRGELWFFMPTGVPQDARFSREEAADLIRKATGIDLPYEVLSTDEWVASELIADRYRLGRAFLIGDACHLHPPFGGYGMNMGVADSVDLGWKIAAMLDGWGGEALLDSYETERRPLHRQVIDEAVANHAVLSGDLYEPGLEDEGTEAEAARARLGARIAAIKQREFKSLGVVLGYCYVDSPLIASEDGHAAKPLPAIYVPSAQPGCVAPHRWLAPGESLYDLFGPGFTLLILDADAKGADRAIAEATEAGIPLKLVDVTQHDLAGLYGARMALIRPDQHVAWRGDCWTGSELLLMVAGGQPASITAGQPCS
ncbi:FAD-dependent monooxygenase [Sphingomonas sp. AOB5]|uniref:FAD-dependent monooxygenase n=1 Tax=Sphingomonas sp. AOB5 TaxID=3034017 RepID=UPI0023F7E73A|nr:FAD-dependent monooxygenase [Sphingomonas sp. AOB5]MDF7775607.1 FAD-dependent monooxygenase [Sphingomonas sp. AOB5]